MGFIVILLSHEIDLKILTKFPELDQTEGRGWVFEIFGEI
jgi:hypothetical protein